MGTLLVRGLLAVALLLTFVFPAWAQDGKGIGVVTAITGNADLKRPQAPQAQALKLRDNLFVRDVVDTHKESLARFLLMGKSTVTVRELSRFEIREEVRPDGSQRALINLAEGKIRVMVARRLMKPGDEVEIRTPNAIAAVRGSDGVIEVSKLPDGRPLTVITGASGEFHVTLPATPPFITKEKEFFEGPVLAGRAPGALVAMAETASDAGPGIRVAQGPGLIVTALVQAQVIGLAGAQALAQALLSQTQLNQLIGNYQLNVGATGATQPPPAAQNSALNQGFVAAQGATLASGAQPVLGGGTAPGSGGGGGTTTVITPLTTVSGSPCCAPTVTTPLYEVIHQVNIGSGVLQSLTLVKTVGTSGGGTGMISVLVYNYGSLATSVSGLGGAALFNATNVTSDSFSLMSTAQIQAYRVLLVGTGLDAVKTGLPTDGLKNTNVGAAINGNQVITGLHIEHGTAGANQLLVNMLQFAAKAGPTTTGLVVATDGCVTIACTGGSGSSGWITKPGSFLQSTFEGKVNRDKGLDNVTISNATHPINTGTGLNGGAALTNAGLSNWGNSVHSTFTCTGKPGATC